MTSGQGALNGALALQEPIHRQITMEIHIDFAFHARQFPQSGVFPLVGERQFAPGVDEASDNHRQAILYPSFFARVKSPVQSKFLGQFQQRIAGPIFLGGKDLEILCGALGHDIATEGSLQQFELLSGKASDADVGGMFDFALLAKGGADKADRSTAVALDFEVERNRFAFNGHQISITSSINQVTSDNCMDTNEIKNGCGLSTEALLAGNLKRRCDYREVDSLLRAQSDPIHDSA